MAPVKQRSYEFNAGSISKLRNRLKLKQTCMAEILGVPTNTLSDWETGAIKPDAESLAAIHSFARENSQTIDFFKRRANPKPSTEPGNPITPESTSLPTAESILRAGIFLDCQNVGISDKNFPDFNKSLRKRLAACFPNLKRSRYRAFPGSGRNPGVFRSNQWKVISGAGDRDQDIVKGMQDYCQSNSKGTALILLTKDGDFANPLKELKSKGVLVYLASPPDPAKKLIEAVGKQNWLDLSTLS